MRSDSLATTIVIAAASTASPASWPPIRRGSSGRADEVCVTPASLLAFAALDGDGDGRGVTVGNRPVRPAGVIVVPGTGANVGGGSAGGVDGGVDGGPEPPWPGCPTTMVTAASAGESDLAATVTASVIALPAVAVDLIRSATFSSNA